MVFTNLTSTPSTNRHANRQKCNVNNVMCEVALIVFPHNSFCGLIIITSYSFTSLERYCTYGNRLVMGGGGLIALICSRAVQ